MNILFKLKPEYNAVHAMLYQIYLFDIKSILFFIEESEIEYRDLIAIALLVKFYSIPSLLPNIDTVKILYNFFVIDKLSNNNNIIYENVFNEFFEYTVIDNESDLLNDFKPYIKVSKNDSCYHGIHTVLYTHDT